MVQPKNKCTVEWMGHGSFKLISGKKFVILIDPWFQNQPGCLSKYITLNGFNTVNLVLITHGHSDHFSINDIKKLVNKFNPKIIAPWELGWLIKKEVPKADVGLFELSNKGACAKFGDVTVHMVSANHSGGVQFKKRTVKRINVLEGEAIYAGEAVGYVIELSNRTKIYHSGDTGLTAEMKLIIKDYYKPNIAILPIGNVFTMNPQAAGFACKLLKPKYIIPGHYKTFPVLTQSTKELRTWVKYYSPSTKVLTPVIGKELII